VQESQVQQTPVRERADLVERPLALTRIPLAAVLAMRPKQWLKNGLIFFGLVYALHLGDLPLVARALTAFVAFCCLSSAGYIFNDLRDYHLDRLHPTKSLRPIASGALTPGLAKLLGGSLFLVGMGLSVALGPTFLAVALGYVALTLSYSLWWKHMVLLDVFSLSGGFVLRAVAGAVAVTVPISPWLYVCTILGSLLISLGKRRSELIEMEGRADHRPALEQYTVEFIDRLIVIAATSSLMAYSLYTFSADNVPRNHLMMVTIPIVFYGVFRYLFLLQAGTVGGRPEDILLSDKNLAAAVLLFLIVSAGVLYLGPRIAGG
jgi:4-hydroxybenzoate polyprenyltransferase